MKHRPKNLLSSVLLLLALAFFTGCRKEPQKSTQPQSAGAEKASGPASETGLKRPQRIAKWEKPYEWNREQIKQHHAKLVLAELPEYIGEVWGCGGKPSEGGILSSWAFVVPQDKIPDFLAYLREMGVPEEYMNKDSPFRSSKRENWIRPDPPVAKLRFLRAEFFKGDGSYRGLDFKASRSRVYAFENLNFARSELWIYFDAVSGNTCFWEDYIEMP